jgi:hypothetical protein
MWLLVVASCIASDPGPACSSGISPVNYPAFEACEDAAVRYHDHMRGIAGDAGLTVLLIHTRCMRIVSGGPA